MGRSTRWATSERGWVAWSCRAQWSYEPMTKSLAAPGSTNDETGALLSVPANASVNEVVEAVRIWISSALPASWLEAGRRGGPSRGSRSQVEGRLRGVVSRLWKIRAGRCHLASRLRRARSLAGCGATGRTGAQPVQPGSPQSAWTQLGCARPLRARYRGAAASFSPSDRSQRRGLVPALQRAGCRFRPRIAGHAGRARRGRLGGHRPEGVDHVGARLGLGRVACPYRRRRTQTPGADVFPHRSPPTRR